MKMVSLRLLLLSAITALLLTGCYRKDVRSFDIVVPELSEPYEIDYIRTVLMPLNQLVPGDKHGPKYQEIVGNVETKTLTITYNARLHSKKNIEHAIADLGYQANDIPGNAERLKATRAKAKAQQRN